MAKRKLTASQRVAIRKELAELLRGGKSQAENLRTVAKKYGITTITARWYLKSLNTSAGHKSVAKKSRPAPARRLRKAIVQGNGRGHRNGAVHRLVANMQAIAEETLARARLAKKLIPEWQAYVKKEFSLRKVERQAREALRRVSRRAQTLHQRIKDLTSR